MKRVVAVAVALSVCGLFWAGCKKVADMGGMKPAEVSKPAVPPAPMPPPPPPPPSAAGVPTEEKTGQ